MNEKKREKSHRDKKDPGMREKYAKERKAKNAARPRQITVEEHFPDGTIKITGPIRPPESCGEPLS